MFTKNAAEKLTIRQRTAAQAVPYSQNAEFQYIIPQRIFAIQTTILIFCAEAIPIIRQHMDAKAIPYSQNAAAQFMIQQRISVKALRSLRYAMAKIIRQRNSVMTTKFIINAAQQHTIHQRNSVLVLQFIINAAEKHTKQQFISVPAPSFIVNATARTMTQQRRTA